MIPNTLGGESLNPILPVDVIEKAKLLRFFAVEEIKSARRLLRKMDREFPIDSCEFFILNKSIHVFGVFVVFDVSKVKYDIVIGF